MTQMPRPRTSPRPLRAAARPLVTALLALVTLALAPTAAASTPAGPATVRVVSGPDGHKLTVDGRDFMVKGVNWDYFPIGTNYNYNFWGQPDDFIKAALANEMTLMRRMGVNAVRLYTGVPPRWIQYIHEEYGIYTILNHTVGRYGYMLGGVWTANVDYSNPGFRAAMRAELAALVEEYKGTPGLLLWLLGNENNYGLSWSSFEIEALPQGEREAAKARHLYSLFGELIQDIKASDPHHPVSIANGDLQYIDLIAQECKGLDVLGSNMYRGYSMRDAYQVVQDKLGVPLLFTEFGADAFDAKRGQEDGLTQARYLLAQWKEIYEQSAGKGKVGNAIGGTLFQWSDGWWKYRQETNLDVHDTNASWPNGGYTEDYVEGENNMNEEWWGVCAKGPPDERGLYELRPRTAYYVLRQAFRLDPYAPGTTPATIAAHFEAIFPEDFTSQDKAAQAASETERLGLVRLTNAVLKLETYSTGGNSLWQRPDLPGGGSGFDHMQSFHTALELNPSNKVRATLQLNVLGNVALNPIDEIFYERRGRPVEVVTGIGQEPGSPPEQRTLTGLERVRVYSASLSWDESLFHLEGFFRTDHHHWSNEGDLFGLYREAHYGANIDVYNIDTPLGIEVTGKRELEGLKLAFGPQLWWGANPAILAKYRRQLGPVTLTLLHQEDLAQAGFTNGTSPTIPQLATRKTALALETRLGILGLELAGLWAGANRAGDLFVNEQGSIEPVLATDALGARAKVTLESGPWHWYAQGAYMGLVAEGGPDARITYTGWTLKDSGSGNQVNALTGLAVNLGSFQIGPNFLWQKPLVGPGPSISSFSSGTRSRNIAEDPFVVRANRETLAAELMLVYDPTPATWMWAWDNDMREDAPLAASVDISFRHMPTTLDATFWFEADGITVHPWERGVPAADVWEVNARIVSNPLPDLRLVGHLYGGNPQSNGQDARQPNRYGGDIKLAWRSLAFSGFARFNDWGPYDYYRDFNNTLPLQLMGDLSYTLGSANGKRFWLWLEQTRLGLRATNRWLNGFSGARYLQDPANPRAWGQEYELRSYLVVTL